MSSVPKTHPQLAPKAHLLVRFGSIISFGAYQFVLKRTVLSMLIISHSQLCVVSLLSVKVNTLGLYRLYIISWKFRVRNYQKYYFGYGYS